MLAKYQIIKQWLEENIENGTWPALSLIPAENQIALQFSASRMTARRAIMELVNQKRLIRQPGLGTFVSENRPTSSLLKIKNIADEVQERGHKYSNSVLKMEETRADMGVAEGLALPIGTKTFYSELLHFESGLPIQLEKRFINPKIAPDYLTQAFNETHTPASFLQTHYPLTNVLFHVHARRPAPEETRHLALEQGDPVLTIQRKTWCKQGIVSFAQLIHPGSRYQLGGELSFSNEF